MRQAKQRQAAVSALNARGYVRRNETMAGKFKADLTPDDPGYVAD